MGSYKLSPEADNDLNVIWLFGLERFGEVQADKFYYELLAQCRAIADNPKHYPATDEIRAGYRRSVYQNHSIFYREISDFVEIMRIYGQQDPKNILG